MKYHILLLNSIPYVTNGILFFLIIKYDSLYYAYCQSLAEISLHIGAKNRPYKVALEILWKPPEPSEPPKMYWVGVAQHKSLEHWVLDRFLQRPTSIDGAETWIGIVGKGSA